MRSDPSAPLSCHLFQGVPGDVDRAFNDLSRDMDPRLVHVFLDKLQRYAAKNDRALFLAESEGKIIAFATIIDRASAPDDADRETARLLQGYGCGTGLMVLPEFRCRGVATLLVYCWERWAQENGLSGVWVVTRKMGEWYQRCFQFAVLGTTVRHKTEKTVLAKPCLSSPSIKLRSL